MRTLTASAIICLYAVMAGCTHNNGDIGLWFGRWQLTEISADGNPLTEYSGNMSWAFQRDIVGITTVTDYHSALETWGQWKSDDNTYLSLNFDYTWRAISSGDARHRRTDIVENDSDISLSRRRRALHI